MKLPVHLNALRAFEASARYQSFSAAAQELSVTPAAVGQLVRGLEEWLGTPLFIRSTSGRARLVTTDAALCALPDIRAGFDRLALGLERLKESAAAGVLTVTVSPAFAAKWLLPRFERFQAICPDTDVRLETSLKPVDFVAQRVDIGVRYGTGTWPGLAAERLMGEEIFPVCSPELLRQNRSLHKLGGITQVTLIHDLSMDGHAGFPTWEKWLKKAKVTDVVTSRGMKINNSAAVLQAAIEGRGIALARSAMAHDDLAAGRLVRLFPEIQYESELAYYVVYRPERASLPRLVTFRDWLMREATLQDPASVK
ncbi:transcriptional regulator GcvA [Pandoraea pulmonicola]|uniref:Gcv operon activator n=1 Tax=Pandoraea pulmonicola TaxID=93221 RepID=A0AAJ4Z8H7_PANPU|nr:transcriptional regulator GcvA [Pandoraea pulmonicola]AJC22193.1 LysR family transcriptional regulator [Pandoraea pulmonicola]SUA88766.1 Gcv operon activator [Pandoraea pulmonicola]